MELLSTSSVICRKQPLIPPWLWLVCNRNSILHISLFLVLLAHVPPACKKQPVEENVSNPQAGKSEVKNISTAETVVISFTCTLLEIPIYIITGITERIEPV